MTGSNNDAWPIADVDRLKDLWGRGWSAGMIRGDMPRYSRNAVIGKIHRLKLTRAPTANRRDKPSKTQKPKPPKQPNPATAWIGRAKPPEPVYVPAEPGAGISLLDLTNSTCRWPSGIVGTPDFCFCGAGGADLIASRPYCREHTRMARKT